MSEPTEIVALYATCANSQQAHEIARGLLERRLVACANIVENVTSLYWWQGEIQQEKEVLLLTKTTSKHVPAAIAAIEEMHHYEVPCITILPIIAGSPQYLEWVKKEVS